mmetsp:Transcript_22984/g.47769  ORF Transcript_22984/g.47769 Transcript_22984/m.47769 type:complete len:137 (+) Transcript_22984:62-472(+)
MSRSVQFFNAVKVVLTEHETKLDREHKWYSQDELNQMRRSLRTVITNLRRSIASDKIISVIERNQFVGIGHLMSDVCVRHVHESRRLHRLRVLEEQSRQNQDGLQDLNEDRLALISVMWSWGSKRAAYKRAVDVFD